MPSVEQLENAIRKAIVDMDDEHHNYYCDGDTIELYGWANIYKEIAIRVADNLNETS